jgi:DNA-binding transcriptional MerR regulator
LTPDEYRFCADAECDVVYFNSQGMQFATQDVRVPVWQKLPFGTRPVCYCFGESEASIRAEFASSGQSSAVERIREHIAAGRCACEIRNPRGACCLGDVISAVKRVEGALVMASGDIDIDHRLMSSKGTFTIGELAARAGMTPDALRYYERLGVIAPITRTSGGFRVYTADVIERIRFIKQAQLHGLTLAEIRELLRLDVRRGASQCREVQQLLTRKLADVDARLLELQDFRRTLDDYLAQCNRTLADTPEAACPVVEDLRQSASRVRR